MKIKFLGTAASEGFPAVFCNCEYCQKARMLKGKNIRTRHQTLINDDLLIDLPADTYMHAINGELRLDKIKHLLITHAHTDHFYPIELTNKVVPYAHNQHSEKLKVYGGQGAFNLYLKDVGDFDINGFKNIVSFNLIECYKPYNIGDGYTITALPARHDFGNDAKIYIIEKDNKRILYAHDTGIFYDEIYDYIANNNLFFNLITLDCTNVDMTWPDESSHMGFCQIERVIDKLYTLNAINDKTIKYVNHFSHNANALQENIESFASKYKLKVAFDGEEITL